ncbi:3-hydroxyacyl-CoA dehydrogenase NAD-binding domain-containing protein [Pseudomonas sp. JAI111]|uniref:3-hydroxyacyl-CoA dehydrogenase NAD-binding domain-containing protein n=1 Tax=Pseudomonas sp. JAI111 TaxID=2735913 RepID=UPI003862077F
MSNPEVTKIAVLGAGVMGAQIAAFCANANIPVVLLDMAVLNIPVRSSITPSNDCTNSTRRRLRQASRSSRRCMR